ncbi:MAG: 50S ribosomal protein L29 [Rhodospirillales bacterium]|nr:50S ribosomal protein L29 [Rhodospirillales bacterium]
MADPIKKFEDLKGKSQDELNKMLLDLRKEQFNMRFEKANGTLDNTSKIRKIRRSIARVKTAQHNVANKG